MELREAEQVAKMAFDFGRAKVSWDAACEDKISEGVELCPFLRNIGVTTSFAFSNMKFPVPAPVVSLFLCCTPFSGSWVCFGMWVWECSGTCLLFREPCRHLSGEVRIVHGDVDPGEMQCGRVGFR